MDLDACPSTGIVLEFGLEICNQSLPLSPPGGLGRLLLGASRAAAALTFSCPVPSPYITIVQIQEHRLHVYHRSLFFRVHNHYNISG